MSGTREMFSRASIEEAFSGNMANTPA